MRTEHANALFYHAALPEPVDEIRYEDDRHSEVETMILRAGRVYYKQPYTYTDCFVVRWPKRRYPFSTGGGGPVRVLDSFKMEQKRREMFSHAYTALVEALKHLRPDVPPDGVFADMRCFAPCVEQLRGEECPCLRRARRALQGGTYVPMLPEVEGQPRWTGQWTPDGGMEWTK